MEVEETSEPGDLSLMDRILENPSWATDVDINLVTINKTLRQRADELKDAEKQLKKEVERKRAQLKEEENTMRAQIQKERKQVESEKDNWATEKEAMERVYTFQSGRLKLDVGGHKFTTSLTTLTSKPESMLAAMFSGRHELIQDEKGAYFLDRDGTHFRFILNYLRDGRLVDGTLPEDKLQLQELLRESDYYGLTELNWYIRAKLMPVVSQQDISSLYSFTTTWPVDGDNPVRYTRQLYSIQFSCMDGKNLANLQFANLYFNKGFSFKGSYLRGANFSGCYFCSNVYFNDADLTDANFQGCGGLLSGHVHFNGARLHDTKFEEGVRGKLTL
jgi:hypothetical protein